MFGYICYQIMPGGITEIINIKTSNQVDYYFFSKIPKAAQLLPTFITPVLFALIEQDLAQRFFAAKNKMVATISAFLSSIFILLFACIPVFFGIYAKVKNIKFSKAGSPLIPLLFKVTSPTVLILATCAIIAAITSTADSLLCATSSNISQDFLPLFPRIKRKLLTSRIISFVAGSSALITSFFINKDIISVIESSYRITVSCLFVPIFIAYFNPHGNKYAALTSMICGAAGFMYVTLFVKYSITHDLLPLGASLAGYMIVAGVGLLMKRFKNV